MDVPPAIPAAMPAPAPMPMPPPPPPVDIPDVSGSSGGSGVGWFTIGLLVIAIALLIAIVVIGRNMGIFRDVPKKEEKKETFEVGPTPSCNTRDTHAIFPTI